MNVSQVGASPHVQVKPQQSFEEAQETPAQKRTERLNPLGTSQQGHTQPKQSPQAVEESSKTSEGPEKPKGGNPSGKGVDKLV
jgi:hypothetical protein